MAQLVVHIQNCNSEQLEKFLQNTEQVGRLLCEKNSTWSAKIRDEACVLGLAIGKKVYYCGKYYVFKNESIISHHTVDFALYLDGCIQDIYREDSSLMIRISDTNLKIRQTLFDIEEFLQGNMSYLYRDLVDLYCEKYGNAFPIQYYIELYVKDMDGAGVTHHCRSVYEVIDDVIDFISTNAPYLGPYAKLLASVKSFGNEPEVSEKVKRIADSINALLKTNKQGSVGIYKYQKCQKK